MSASLLGAPAAPPQKPGGTSPPASASPTPNAETPIPLTDIAGRAQTETTRLNAFIADAPADESIAATRQALPNLTAAVNQWLAKSSKTLNQRPSLDALRELQTGGAGLASEVTRQSTVLNERGPALDSAAAEIRADETLWTATDKAAKEASAPPETQALCQGVLKSVQDATAKIKARRTSILELQSQLGALAGKLTAGLETVQQANSAALKTLFVPDSAPLWAPQTNTGANGGEIESPAEQASDVETYVREHLDLIFLHAAIFIGLLGILLWLRHGLRKMTEAEPNLQQAAPILEVPIATALALSFLVKGTIYAGAPNMFRAALGAVLLLPVIVLLRRLLDRRLHAALNFLILFYAVGQVRTTLAALLLLNRWIFSVELVAAAAVFFWVTRTSRLSSGEAETGAGAVLGRWPRNLCRLAILLLVGALAAEVLGYVRLGTIVGTAVLSSSYVAVVLYALVHVLGGVWLIALRVPPLSLSHIVRKHQAQVHRRVVRGLALLAFLVWSWLTLGLFAVQNLVSDWIVGALKYRLPTGTLSLTIGGVLGFAASIWISVLIGRLVRFILEEEVFERVHLSPGLPYAISTMLNYTVLFVGSLIALGLLGVERTQITVLAGAFSVGLGFGLQNIINNFVSGIILLFERPVKVGDIIQIGDAIGEVRRIGIRASVIGTRDGSDVIVPNGNLISNQFTNWTYSDRHRFVEIPLSIASGPDPNHVLALLKTAAAGHSATKDQAAPEAYITALNAASINLVVRAWISHYEDWVQTRSELAVALVAALAREDIKLA